MNRIALAFLAPLAVAAAALQEAGPLGAPIVLHPDATSIDSFDTPSLVANHAIAYSETDDRYLSVFTLRGAARDLYGVLVDPATGAVGAPIPMETSVDSVAMPVLSWNPATGRFLAVFLRNATGAVTPTSLRPSVYGLVLEPDGTPVGGAGAESFPIASAQRLASPGYEYLPEQENFGTSFYAYLSLGRPSVACSGSTWLVTWQADYNINGGLYPLAIEARAVGGASTNESPAMATPILPVSSSGFYDQGPQVVYNRRSGRYLVTWFGALTVPDTERAFNGVLGRGYSDAGVAGPEPTAFYSKASDLGFRSQPVVAANDSNGEFFVTWATHARWTQSVLHTDILGRRVDGQGQALGEIIPIHPEDAARVIREPSLTVVWNRNARQYAVFWSDTASQGPDYSGSPFPYLLNVSRVGASGTVLDPGSVVATLASTVEDFEGLVNTFSASSRSGGAPEAAVQWHFNFALQETPPALRLQRYTLGPDVSVPLLSDAGQFRVDGITAVAPGGVTPQTGVTLKGVVSLQVGDRIRLEAELRAEGEGFTGTPSAAGVDVASGAAATVRIDGLERGKSYRWKLRAASVSGERSAWFEPAAGFSVRLNNPPTASSVVQARAGGGELAPGEDMTGHEVLFRVVAQDPDGDEVKVQVEVQPLGQDFTGVPTGESAYAAPGSALEVRLEGLAELGYRWRYRIGDIALGLGAWTDFGANADSEADFELAPFGSSSPASCGGAARASAAPLLLLVLVPILFLREGAKS